MTNQSDLRKADRLATDAGLRDKFLAAKRGAKTRFVEWIKATAGVSLDPDTMFDVQVKRIHEYKRPLLNAIQVVVWYNRLRTNTPGTSGVRRPAHPADRWRTSA